MAYELKEGQGSLFKNTRKEKDSQPDYKGEALINGRSCWLSAWLRVSKDGKTYMSLSVEPKEQDRPAPKARPQRDDVDSDIPF